MTLDLSVKANAHMRETAIRSFFMRRNVAPSRDYLAGNGRVPDAVRVLHFPLSADALTIARLAADLLKKVYRLKSRSALNIRFSEREQPNNAMDADTVRSTLRAPHGAGHRGR